MDARRQALFLCASSLLACNTIFDISPGTLGGGGAGGQTSSSATSTGGGPSSSSTGTGAGGAGGSGVCPPFDITQGCEDSLLSDPANCCVAGRSCLGGACVAGMCQPVVIDPSASTDTRGISVVGDRVYWSTGTNELVKSRDKNALGYLEVAHDAQWIPSIATDATHVYWLQWQGGQVRRAPLSGSDSTELVASVSSTPDWGRIAVGPGAVYWATKNTTVGVWSAPIAPITEEVFAVASESGSGLSVQTVEAPTGVAVDTTHLYFSDSTDPNGRILRRTLAGISAGEDVDAEVFADQQASPGDIAVDATHVYWVGSGQVCRRDKQMQGPVEVLITGEASPNALVVDDRFVYWVNIASDANGEVRRMFKAGGGATTLAGGQKSPWEIAADCAAIYWTNQNDFGVGEVVKVAK